MRSFLQACVLAVLISAPGFSQLAPEKEELVYRRVNMENAIFIQGVVMMGREQDEYASNLTAHAVARLSIKPLTAENLQLSRRMIALSLHLSPRNKNAVVANFQLAKGVSPKKITADYSAEVFARLLVTRGQLLAQQEGEKNQYLARCFWVIAAQLDPQNEDAVYASEVAKVDYGALDWSQLTGE